MSARIDALRIVLGDQLTARLSALQDADKAKDVIFLAEIARAARNPNRHKKKIAFLFAAMRAFARELQDAGWRVHYVRLDDPANTGSLTTEIARAVRKWRPARLVTTEAGSWRALEAQREWGVANSLPLSLLTDDRFLCSRAEFADWAKDRISLRMEYFYRDMRRRTGLLMDGDEPEGGRWNFDSENRKPAKADLLMLPPLRFKPSAETSALIDMVGQRFADHFGDLEPFWFPVTRADAEKSRDQDAMLRGEKFLYHSILAPALNIGLLDPLDLCRRAEAAYRKGAAPLNAVEGFIRQIIGWREYVRGIYWLNMPGYLERNALDAKRELPTLYWTAQTDMTCMRETITQTKEDAYAHHIQRLMVTGNFAMMAGVDPHQVHEWYLAVYADAYEWVEAPNTIGMSQFADGGLLGSKPYAGSGAYINRMSDYCKGCAYKVTERTGSSACPFNYLYWDFMARNDEKLRRNPRMAQPYRIYDKFADDHKAAIAKSAGAFLQHLAKHGDDRGFSK
jgi:deoxyribodipyrimidine photolyase-related protein